MALTIDYRDYLRLLPRLKEAPQGNVWLSYDAGADVLYVTFQQPSVAADSELTDDETVVGLTILRASQR